MPFHLTWSLAQETLFVDHITVQGLHHQYLCFLNVWLFHSFVLFNKDHSEILHNDESFSTDFGGMRMWSRCGEASSKVLHVGQFSRIGILPCDVSSPIRKHLCSGRMNVSSQVIERLDNEAWRAYAAELRQQLHLARLALTEPNKSSCSSSRVLAGYGHWPANR